MRNLMWRWMRVVTRVRSFRENETFEPIEPPWQTIKQWISADDDEIVVVAEGHDPGWHDQHSNESPLEAKKNLAR